MASGGRGEASRGAESHQAKALLISILWSHRRGGPGLCCSVSNAFPPPGHSSQRREPALCSGPPLGDGTAPERPEGLLSLHRFLFAFYVWQATLLLHVCQCFRFFSNETAYAKIGSLCQQKLSR